jgi:thiol-disulfide isomerase/thioredoxin
VNPALALFAAIALAAPALAQDAKPSVPAVKIEQPSPKAAKPPEKAKKSTSLKVGSPAPAITADNWVKGTEVKKFEKGKVYVVEFWATWCRPCRDSIPHLTELAKAHKAVTFIGMASSERPPKDGKDNRLDAVKDFVSSQGAKMDYTVAFDRDRKMYKAWMDASGQDGIPAAFIVDGEGKIAFIGHPMADGFATKIKELSKSGGKAEPVKTEPAKVEPSKPEPKKSK